jgi:hypothetical protein
VIARGVSVSAGGGLSDGRSYLEKIVQVAYRVPPPPRPKLEQLIQGYAQRSRADSLLDQAVVEILAERAGRNPRRIKRIINSFVVEYQVNPTWGDPPLSGAHLATVILLQQLYPSFYELLVSDDHDSDPTEAFLTYANFRARAVDPPKWDDPWWGDEAEPAFATQKVALSDRTAPALFIALQQFGATFLRNSPRWPGVHRS